MRVALEYLGSLKKKKIAVLGDMLELGQYSDEFHEKVGRLVCENNIDILVTVGMLSKKIVEGAVNAGMEKSNLYNVDNNSKAVNILKDLIKNDTAVLIKASNSMNFIEIYNSLKMVNYMIFLWSI